MDSGKQRIAPKEALALVRKHKRLVVAKGKSFRTLDVRGADDDAITAAVIGPTGWLRAPTWIHGTTIVVGFHADAYAGVLAT